MEAAEAGMWQWLVHWIKEYHACEGEWPIFSKTDKAMLKKLANREFCEPRFLHLPARYARPGTTGDRCVLRVPQKQRRRGHVGRRGRHSHHLVNVRLIIPEDPDDLFDPLAVFVELRSSLVWCGAAPRMPI